LLGSEAVGKTSFLYYLNNTFYFQPLNALVRNSMKMSAPTPIFTWIFT